MERCSYPGCRGWAMHLAKIAGTWRWLCEAHAWVKKWPKEVKHEGSRDDVRCADVP